MSIINEQLEQYKEHENNLKARLSMVEDELLKEKEEKKAIQDRYEELKNSIEVDHYI